MAIELINKPNVDGVSAGYPYGKIKDKTGSTPGTPVNALVYGDFHQFFAKLMAASAIGYNGLPDNESDGFQYYEALLEIMKGEDWDRITLYENTINTIAFRKDVTGFVHITGVINQGGTPRILPEGFRPAGTQTFYTMALRQSGDITIAVNVQVDSNGLITCPTFGIGAGAINVAMINFSFKVAP